MESNEIVYRATKEDIEFIKNSFLFQRDGEELYIAHEENEDCYLFKTSNPSITNAALRASYHEIPVFLYSSYVNAADELHPISIEEV